MSQNPVDYYILCRDQLRIDQWKIRSADINNIEFRFLTGFNSMYDFIRKAIVDCQSPFLVVAHDDVIVGKDFSCRVHSLVKDLETSFPSWGVVGNAGVDVEGRARVYVKDPWCVPQLADVPEPVACVDGNLMLINRRRYLETACEYPDLGGFHGYDLVFSFECLRKGLLVLADGRLRAVHLSGGNRGIYEKYIDSNVFQDYFRERFSDHFIPTMLGLRAVLERPDADAPFRPDLRSLQDLALANAQNGPLRQLAVIDCRPDPKTPLSLDIPRKMATLLDIVKIGLSATDDSSDPADSRGFLAVPSGSSMGTIVQEAFRRLPHDYFWFITETVACDADVLAFVARAWASTPDALVIGNYCTATGTDSRPREQLDSVLMRAIFQVGHFPLSALFIPARPLRDSILESSLAPCQVDGALVGAMALATPGVRFVPMSPRIIATSSARSTYKQDAGAYGREEDWNYIERSALFNSIAKRGNILLWAMAHQAALTEPPSLAARCLHDIHSVWRAGRQVLRQPGSYLGRGLSLAFGYFIRGDIQGLIREARLFRPR